MTQPEQPGLGDLVVEDLERQLSEPDLRYARKCRELAILRAQYAQLMDFVRTKKDVLGLTEVGADGLPLPGQEPAAADPVEETPSASSTNGRAVAKPGT